MKLVTSILSLAVLAESQNTANMAYFDPTQSCSSKTDMAGYECCAGHYFYNCIPTEAVSFNQCNCNPQCTASADCCNDQASFCVDKMANSGPTTTPVHMTFEAPSSALLSLMYSFGLGALNQSLFDHGCYCPLLSELTVERSNYGGEPIDELDQICKEFHNAVSCVKQAPANCPYFTEYNAIFNPQTFEITCTGGGCDLYHCKLAEKYAMQLLNHIQVNVLPDPSVLRAANAGECARRGSGNTRDMCCMATLQKYDSISEMDRCPDLAAMFF